MLQSSSSRIQACHGGNGKAFADSDKVWATRTKTYALASLRSRQTMSVSRRGLAPVGTRSPEPPRGGDGLSASAMAPSGNRPICGPSGRVSRWPGLVRPIFPGAPDLDRMGAVAPVAGLDLALRRYLIRPPRCRAPGWSAGPPCLLAPFLGLHESRRGFRHQRAATLFQSAIQSRAASSGDQCRSARALPQPP
jgi:hypothetical protein